MSESFAIGLAIGLLLVYMAIIGLGIASYVVSSLGLQKLAKKYQLDKAWLAWLPVGCDWLLGKLVEKAEEGKEHKRNWGKILLILAAVSAGGILIFYIVYIVFMVIIVSVSDMLSIAYAVSGGLVVCTIALIFGSIIMTLAAVAYIVCLYICMYKNFEALVPEKSLKYMLLAVLVPLAKGILYMKCAKNIPDPEVEVPMPVMIPETKAEETFAENAEETSVGEIVEESFAEVVEEQRFVDEEQN